MASLHLEEGFSDNTVIADGNTPLIDMVQRMGVGANGVALLRPNFGSYKPASGTQVTYDGETGELYCGKSHMRLPVEKIAQANSTARSIAGDVGRIMNHSKAANNEHFALAA